MNEFVEIFASDESSISIEESVETFVMLSASDSASLSIKEKEGQSNE